MSLFTDEIYVEIHSRGNIMFVNPVIFESHEGYRKAKRRVLQFLGNSEGYSSAIFYSKDGKFLKEIGL